MIYGETSRPIIYCGECGSSIPMENYSQYDDACEDCMIDKEEDLELIMKLDAESKGLISYNCPKCETLNFLKVGNNHCVNCQNEIWRKTV